MENRQPERKERTSRRKERVLQVLAQRQPDLTLVLANIHDPPNVSAIYRSCDAFGLLAVHLYYTDTPFPILSKKTSASARKWVETVRHRDLHDLQSSLTGYQILVTNCSPEAKPLGSFDLTVPTAIVMGNEHRGVEVELASIATAELYIPMYGMIQSFNVSVAAAIILAEAARQRQLVGLYAHPRFDAEHMQQLAADWLER